MLTDEIRKTVKNMKKLDTVESAVQNAEKRAKNDTDFSNLVSEFTISAIKIAEAKKQLGFNISPETLGNIEEGIRKIEDVISSGVVDEIELASAKQHVTKKISPNIIKEWKEFYQKKTGGLSAKLATMGSLIQEPDQIIAIKKNISNGSDWVGLSLKDDGINTRLDLLTEGISQVDQLEKGLNLSDDIKNFIVQVTSGKARVTDLTPSILNWINEEGMEDRFVISFKLSG